MEIFWEIGDAESRENDNTNPRVSNNNASGRGTHRNRVANSRAIFTLEETPIRPI
jgi:hypothetical protein